jgi:hypothetical protein
MPFRLKDKLRSRTSIPLVLIVMFAALCVYMAVDSTAQNQGKAERKIFRKLPAHLPLKVEVRNLDEDTWADDLEIEVWNTSNKPIYFLDFFVVTPEIKSESGDAYGFAFKYGRIQFVSFLEPVQPDDVPIKPGESHIFKIRPQEIEGWKKAKQAKGLADPTKLELIFGGLNYGDGTGYSFTNGTPIDVRKTSSNIRPDAERNSQCNEAQLLNATLLKASLGDEAVVDCSESTKTEMRSHHGLGTNL